MEAEGTGSLVGILPILAAGFIFNGLFYVTRFRLSRADGQRLFFSCAISGFAIGCVAFASCYALRSQVPQHSSVRRAMDWLHLSIPIPYGLTFLATILLAFVAGHSANLYLWLRKKYKAPKDKRRVSVWAYWRSMPEYITALDELIRRAVFDDALVLLCLKSRKVYCGVIYETRGDHESAVAQIQFIPAFSISRNKDTLQFMEETKTQYRAYNLKRAFERKDTLDSLIRDTIKILKVLKGQIHEASLNERTHTEEIISVLRGYVRGLIKEKSDLRRALLPYIQSDAFDPSEWVKVIPVTEIESASLYKDEDYDKWFSSTTDTDIPVAH